MLLEWMRKEKGYISIFLCIVLLPMVTYATMIVDASRVQMSRVQLQTAGDLAMNAALSEYEQTLESMYGLFAVAKRQDDLKPAIERYFRETIQGAIDPNEENKQYTQQLAKQLAALVFGSGNQINEEDINNFIEMQLEEFTYQGVEPSRLSNPKIMKTQIIDYMKYKGPVSLATNLMEKIGLLQDTDKQIDAVEKKIAYTQAVSELQPPFDNAWDAIEEYNKIRDQYEAANYSNKDTVSGYIKQNMEGYQKMAKVAAFQNNFDKQRKKAIEGVITDGEDLVKHVYGDSIFSFESMDTSSLVDAAAMLDQIERIINENIVDLNSSIDYNNIYRDSSNAYCATTGNVSSWNSALSGAENADQIQNFYTKHIEFLPHYEKILERKAQYEYFCGLHRRYADIINNHRAEMEQIIQDEEDRKAAETAETTDEEEPTEETTPPPPPAIPPEDAQKYLDLANQLNTVESNWSSNGAYQTYLTFIKKVFGDDAPKRYFTIGDNIGIDPNFKTFYAKVVSVTDSVGGDIESSTVPKDGSILERITTLRTEVSNVDQLGEDWGATANKVGDATVRAEMLSDQQSSTQNISGDDAQALYEVVNEIWCGYTGNPTAEVKGLKGLLKDIRSAKCQDKKLCEGISYQNFLDMPELAALDSDTIAGDAVNTQYEQFKNDKCTFGTFLVGDNVTDNLKYLPKINGKADSAADPACLDEEPKEVFYYVLKKNNEAEKGENQESLSTEGNGTDKDGDDTKSDQAMLNDINNAPKSAESAPEAPATEPPATTTEPSATTTAAPATGSADEVQKAYSDITAKNVPAEDKTDYGEASGGDIPSGKDKKAYNDSAEEGKKSLGLAKTLLQGLKNVATRLAQDVYLEEYFTEMFTCQTDAIARNKDKVELLNGYKSKAGENEKALNTANPWYGMEIEYILWGNSDLGANLKTTETYIYLIRFALNAIYAFQAADITSFASMVATASVGWCPVLIPIVKVAVVLGIALAESAYDLMLLKDGQGVALLKNGSTFICSPRGALAKVGGQLAEKAIEKGAEYVESKLDDAIDKIGNKVISTGSSEIDQCNQVLQDYANSLADDIESSFKDMVVTPIMNSVEAIVVRVDDSKKNAEKLLDDALEKAWLSVDNSMKQVDTSNTGGQILQELYNKAKTGLNQEVKTSLKKIFDEHATIPMSTKNIEDAIWTPVETWVENNRNLITSKTDAAANSMKASLKDHIENGETEIKSKMHDLIDEKADEFSKKSTVVIENVTAKYSTGTERRDKTGSSGVTLNYKEFCKIFMFIKLAANSEDACLLRSAALVQANVRYAAEKPNKDFTITSAYTMVNVNATVKMGTIFPWTVSVDTNDTGDAQLNPDMSDLGQNTVKINYSGVNGY